MSIVPHERLVEAVGEHGHRIGVRFGQAALDFAEHEMGDVEQAVIGGPVDRDPVQVRQFAGTADRAVFRTPGRHEETGVEADRAVGRGDRPGEVGQARQVRRQ